MNKSFTLIEILVVIVIIGIISAFIIVGMNSISSGANIAKIKVFSSSLKNSLLINIMGEWRFDDVSGTEAKDGWSNLNGTLQGFTDTSAGYGDNNASGWMSPKNCISGTCLKVDTAQYVSVATAFPAIGDNSFTMEAWAKTDSVDGASHSIFSLSVSGITNWRGILNFPHAATNKALMYVRASCYRYSLKNINDNEWYHVVGVFDRSKTAPEMYINGKLDNGNSSSSECATTGTIPSGTIGLATNSYKGVIDEFRIYNAAVPVSQIQQNYYSGLKRLLANKEINSQEIQKRLSQLKQ